jgi:peptidyl-dipeptidase Dcp
VHLDFVRAGARLQGAARERYAQVMEELAGLTTRFAQNVLHDESSYGWSCPGEADLAGLPDFVRAAAAPGRADRGLPGHVITLSRSLVVPFLTFSNGATCASRPGAPGPAAANTPASTTTARWRATSCACAANRPRLHGHACYADTRWPTPWPATAPRCRACSTRSGRAPWRRGAASVSGCCR